MRRAKEDTPPKEGANSVHADSTPSIEETLAALTDNFLENVDAASRRYAKSIKATWHGITPSQRVVFAAKVRDLAKIGLRTPAHAASLADMHRSAPGLAWKADK